MRNVYEKIYKNSRNLRRIAIRRWKRKKREEEIEENNVVKRIIYQNGKEEVVGMIGVVEERKDYDKK